MRCFFNNLIVVVLLMSVFSCKENETDAVKVEEPQSDVRTTILSGIKQKKNLVTTEVKIRKLAIYDSESHEKFVLTDIKTWKYGARKCVIPVDVTISYGYDLRDIGIDDIQLTDSTKAVTILLPKAKVIDSGFNPIIDRKNIVRMSTGLRDPITHEEEDRIVNMAYDSVMKEDFSNYIDEDLNNNAKTVFISIIKSLGLEYTDVIVVDKEEWKGGKR